MLKQHLAMISQSKVKETESFQLHSSSRKLQRMTWQSAKYEISRFLPGKGTPSIVMPTTYVWSIPCVDRRQVPALCQLKLVLCDSRSAPQSGLSYSTVLKPKIYIRRNASNSASQPSLTDSGYNSTVVSLGAPLLLT